MLAGLFFLSGCQLFQRDADTAPPFMIASFQRTLSKIDPPDTEFPGGRGTDELVLYTPKFGQKTGTNEWGSEALIQDGIVQKLGGNNSLIPRDGFVLSGHGKSERWILDNLFPGVEITLTGKQVQGSITDRTRLFYADHLIREASEFDTSHSVWDPKVSPKDLESLKKESGKWEKRTRKARIKGDTREILASSQKCLDAAYDFYCKSQRSQQFELRACWYRLTEKTPEELEKTIRRLKEAGFNCLCPETIYWGYAIYPDAHPLLKQNPAFLGWDPLKELCRLCHQYNMKVIPWVEVFFIGFQDSPLKVEKSEWLAFSRSGQYPSALEQGYYYFCPSRKDVREFWLQVYEHLLKTYEVDGLQLDYIRYPRSVPMEHGYCYCSVCRERFFGQNGVDPAFLNPETSPDMADKWNAYRRDQVSEFVRQTSILVNEVRPDARLSVDVFPDLKEARETKFQDWSEWVEKGYVDEVFIMSYSTDREQVRRDARSLIQILPQNVKGYVGLGPFLGFPPRLLLDEVRAVHESGAHGICLFDFEHLTEGQISALKKGPFRLPAYIP